jgi:hypothetical protein
MPRHKSTLGKLIGENDTDNSSRDEGRTGMVAARPEKGTRPAVAPEQLREERLKEAGKKDDPRIGPTLPLKRDAGQMEVGWARRWEDGLRDLLEKDPQLFRALEALVEGRPEGVSEQHFRDLRESIYLLPDGSPHPDVKAIMMAAYRQTPEGPAVVDPLDVRSPEDAATVQHFDDQREERRRRGADRLRRLLFDQDTDEGKGRSR